MGSFQQTIQNTFSSSLISLALKTLALLEVQHRATPPPRPTPTLQGPGHPDLPNLPRNPIAISSQPFIPKRTCPCEVASRAADAADPCSPLPSGYGHGAGGTPDNNKNATHKKRVVT